MSESNLYDFPLHLDNKVLCTKCQTFWIASSGLPCDCLSCGQRLLEPDGTRSREEELSNTRKIILQRIK